MSEHMSGLRFDIYERIHLPEEAVGILQLEEIELVPHIEVRQQEEQAIIFGHLVLSGQYVGDHESRASVPMEYAIPVEITLPLNRVSSLDEVAVEIEHFDVDQLSRHSMNVTGVLLLRGIEMISNTPRETWSEEEYVVVHQAYESNAGQQAEEEYNPYALRVEATDDERNEPAAQAIQAEPAEQEHAAVANEEAESLFAQQEIEAVPVYADQDDQLQDHAAWSNNNAAEDREFEPVDEDEEVYTDSAADAYAYEPLAVASSPVVAFTAAPEVQAVNSTDASYSLHSLLRTSAAQRDARIDREEQDIRAQSAQQLTSGDDLEWKRLFLSRGDQGPRSFSRLRFCIVHKSDTLDSIADRYSMHAGALLQHNRLSEQDISEGQVIYIP